jgi:hypothetical protein
METRYVSRQAEYIVASRRIAGSSSEKLAQIDEAIQELMELKILECVPEQGNVRFLAVPRRTHWFAMTVTILALLVMLVLLLGVRSAHAQTASGEATPTPASDDQANLAAFVAATRFGVDVDGYYAWNTNRPAGRVNALRAYDVLANSFSLNQAGIVVDHAPNPTEGTRFGLRLDLMYGQATETLQGSAANEPRPQVYRPLFQAYGSYVFPVGSGLQVDFGKFASAFGFENNYSKDQINYSRSYFFNYLPFYHMGFRTSYAPDRRVTLAYWLVNGAQQTEDFNEGKSQAVLVTLAPVKSVSWNVNYFTGKEGPNLVLLDESSLHIFDTYATWNVSPRVTLAGEGDYVSLAPPSGVSGHVKGGAGYVQVKFRPDMYVAGRAEYFSDRDGLFSGVSQLLQEVTGTFSWQPDPHVLVRAEARHDWSDIEFFPTDTNRRARAQTTYTLGLTWWVGTKEGAW